MYLSGEFNYKIPAFKVLEKPVSEFEKKHLDLLLPFYLLKFRRELRKKNVGSEKRKEIARQMNVLISEIDRILEKHSNENLISREDVLLLVHEFSRMHEELYGSYKEFKEVNMTLLQKVRPRYKDFEKRGALKVLELVEQGYKPAEIKKMILT